MGQLLLFSNSLTTVGEGEAAKSASTATLVPAPPKPQSPIIPQFGWANCLGGSKNKIAPSNSVRSYRFDPFLREAEEGPNRATDEVSAGGSFRMSGSSQQAITIFKNRPGAGDSVDGLYLF